MHSVKAHAKLNLYLHVTEKRPDGYHELDSLVVFTELHDLIEFKKSENFSFSVQGPMAAQLSGNDIAPGENSANLAVRAAIMMARMFGKTLDYEITLTKNIPVGAGLGGGSADAAAVIEGLVHLWKLDIEGFFTKEMMAEIAALGADVPVCLYQRPCRMQGIGEVLFDIEPCIPLPVVLVYPSVMCPTAKMFAGLKSFKQDSFPIYMDLETMPETLELLQAQENDFEDIAVQEYPVIGEVLQALDSHSASLLTRMTGSGSACFAICETTEEAYVCAKDIQDAHPDWWVCATETLPVS